MLTLFIKSFFIGFIISATIGPVAVLCFQRVVHRGFLSGLFSGLGASTGDAIFGFVIGFGFTSLAMLLIQFQLWISAVGGIIIVYFGLKSMSTKEIGSIKQDHSINFVKDYFSTLLLVLLNPITIVYFVSIFANLGLLRIGNSFQNAGWAVSGIFIGSLTWTIIMSSIVALLRERFRPSWLLIINKIAGGVLIILGIYFILSTLRPII